MASSSSSSSSSSSVVKMSVGILSIGDMGMGVAKLLIAHGHTVMTVAAGRSQSTRDRIKAAAIIDLPTDEDLVVECDIILSIVPPRDAVSTAKRIQEACKTTSTRRTQRKGFASLLYIDLNAISPRTTKRIAAFFATTHNVTPSITRRLSRSLSSMGSNSSQPDDWKPVAVRYLDGGIIGGPPSQLPDKSWKRPSIVISGPKSDFLSPEFVRVLNIKLISDEIGAASTLKACFATFGKGLFGIAIASFTTAQSAGVLPELQDHLKEFFPSIHAFVEKGLPSVPPKAYRWVDEMKQIGETLSDQGHFQPSREGQAIFDGMSDIYKLMANDTALGRETIGKRKRGTTVEDVAECMREGIAVKRATKPADEKLEMAWRSSWT